MTVLALAVCAVWLLVSLLDLANFLYVPRDQQTGRKE